MTDFFIQTPSGNMGRVNGNPNDEEAVKAIPCRMPSAAAVIDAASNRLSQNKFCGQDCGKEIEWMGGYCQECWEKHCAEQWWEAIAKNES